MKLTPPRFTPLVLLVALAATSAAQTFTVPTTPRGVTTLVLGAAVATSGVEPAPGSRVRVPPLEKVHLRAPDGWPYPIQWTKDNKPIAGATGTTFSIPLTATADSGRYNLTGAPSPFSTITTGIDLDVVEPGHTGNFSTRLELAPGTTPQIVGFIVAGRTRKYVFIRAVGPTLKTFGLEKPAAQPSFRLFDASGQELNFARTAVVLFDWSAVFAAAGAFPLTGGERSYLDYGLTPGAYTIHVSDSSKQGGTVLLEVYEFASTTPGFNPTVVTPTPPVVTPPIPGG